MDQLGVMQPANASRGSGSTMLYILHKDPRRGLALSLEQFAMVLRAESSNEKHSWLSRLKRCAEGSGAYVAPLPCVPPETAPASLAGRGSTSTSDSGNADFSGL